jgi:hypothetical protein
MTLLFEFQNLESVEERDAHEYWIREDLEINSFNFMKVKAQGLLPDGLKRPHKILVRKEELIL